MADPGDLRAVLDALNRCQVEGCSDFPRCRGLCNAHYKKFLKYEDPLYKYEIQICSVDGCIDACKARGYCSAHYNSWKRYGDPIIANTYRWPDRLWSRIDKKNSKYHKELGQCWEWRGATTGKSGYGQARDINGNNKPVHRIIYGLYNELDDDLAPDHLCRNKICVRPYHLEPVIKIENIRRAVESRHKLNELEYA